MRKEDSINRPTDQCFVFNLIKNRFACANSVLILQTLFWSPWWLTIVAQELKFADYDHCTVQTAQYYIQYYCYNTHTHRTLVLCVFVYMRSVPFQGGKGSFFCVFNPFNGGLESSYTSYMCPTLLHCLPVQRIWSEENDPEWSTTDGFIMSNSLKAQEFGEKQLSAVCAKKPGSFCPEVCMVIPPVFITLPT